uniref:interleukin-31 receptor subunit alpha isoform X2 n=1 Tax=Scatophagus argus TaxID=75038 RepID=UPI001ED7FF25|nr:interleukin-31 receptor subunit alpha isoform X2 [Scatophagus argus]
MNWSPQLRLASCTMVNLLCVFSYELTVKSSNLKLCEKDKQVCVTDIRDCGPHSIQKSLNISCYYQISHRSMTCEWSEESSSNTMSDFSLVFRSRDNVISCQGIFSPAAILNITARIRDYTMGSEIWSYPHTVLLYDIVKPSQPVLTVLGSTVDSVHVSWRSSSRGSCRLRYRVNHTHRWTQAPHVFPAHQDQTVTYKIKGLLPFTVYRAAVACRGTSNIWSDWSFDVTARTLDRVPSWPLEVCYRVEKTDLGSFLLHLIWKDYDLLVPGGHILGYQVSYKPVMKKQQLQGSLIQNVTEGTALLVVQEGNCSVTVRAFNMAGYGPATHLSIDTQRHITLPSVRNLWVSSTFPALKGLLVQWEKPTAPPSAPPVSHFVVQWHSETRPSTSRWKTVDRFNTTTVILDVDPSNESYLISVFPVYNQQCGSPQSLPASLQQGALMEAVNLKVLGTTKTTVTAAWEWQRKSGPVRVNRYRVMLRKESERQTLSLWPDQWQHILLDLKPNTEYSLVLLADNISQNIIPARTVFDEVPVVAAVTPLLLLAVAVFIISILSRTVYKSYFFPPISNPRGSNTGQWLMDPNRQKTAQRNFLDIEDFRVTDVQKSLIMVSPISLHSSEEDLHEDTSLLSINHVIIQMSALKLDTEYVSNAPVITERQLVSLQSCKPDYAINCLHPDRVFISEESQADDAALLYLMQEGNTFFLQKEEETRQTELTSQKEIALKHCFREFIANMHSHCVYQLTCEPGYITSQNI